MVVTLNFHRREVKGFFSSQTPCLNVDVSELCVPYFSDIGLKDVVLISSD